MTHKKARKSGGGRGGKVGKTAMALPESPQKRKQAAGARTRRQAQLEDEEEVVVKQEGTDVVIKTEDDDDLGLPSIGDIINGQVVIRNVRFGQGRL